MAEVLLPGGQAADINRQRQKQAELISIRLGIATQVFAGLLQAEYQRASMKALERDSVYGGADPDDGEPKRVTLNLDVGTPAGIAVQAAENLMVALGLIEMVKPPINSGPR